MVTFHSNTLSSTCDKQAFAGANDIPFFLELQNRLLKHGLNPFNVRDAAAIRSDISKILQLPWQQAYRRAEAICLRGFMEHLSQALSKNEPDIATDPQIKESNANLIVLAELIDYSGARKRVANMLRQLKGHLQHQ
ncbi:MAG: hypothetical protein ABI230_07575 [Aestuariivirga sp.]